MNEEEVKEEQVTQEAPAVQEEPVVVTEPTPPEKKGGKALIIVMGLIILLLVIFIAFLLLNGDKKNTNSDNKESNNNVENNNQENTNNENNENNNNTINIDDIIEPTFASVACGGSDFDFKKETVLAKDIKANYKLGMLATVLSRMIDTKNLVAGVETELDIDIYEIAQKYFDITPEMETQMGDGFGTGFLWFSRKNQKSFVTLEIGGCIGPDNEGNYAKLKDIKQEGNTLISTYYYYYNKNSDVIEDPAGGVQFPYSYYKSESDTTPVYKDIVNDDSVDFEKFDTYDLYFDISSGSAKLIKVVYNAK